MGSELVFGTASLYQRITDNVFIIITAASNFAIYEKNKAIGAGGDLIPGYYAVHPTETYMFLQRQGENKCKTRFKVRDYLLYD